MTRLIRDALVLLLLPLSLHAAADSRTPGRYQVIELAPEFAPEYYRPGQLNNSGDYTVRYISDSPSVPDGESIRYANGERSMHFGSISINDSGQGAGTVVFNTGGPYQETTYPVVWTGSSVVRPSHQGMDFWGSRINNSGQVLGRLSAGDPSYDSEVNFVYDIDTGGFTQLGTLGGKTWAADINDHGLIVGVSETADGTPHAFSYQDGVMTDLGDLGGDGTFVSFVNNSGQILGGYAGHSILYSNGALTDLTATLGTAFIVGFNDLGQILYSGQDGLMLWQDGRSYSVLDMIDNDTRYQSIWMISDMNDRGEILGLACPTSGSYEYECAFIKLSPLAAIPEPTTWSMLTLGIILLGAGARRQRKSAGARG